MYVYALPQIGLGPHSPSLAWPVALLNMIQLGLACGLHYPAPAQPKASLPSPDNTVQRLYERNCMFSFFATEEIYIYYKLGQYTLLLI